MNAIGIEVLDTSLDPCRDIHIGWSRHQNLTGESPKTPEQPLLPLCIECLQAIVQEQNRHHLSMMPANGTFCQLQGHRSQLLLPAGTGAANLPSLIDHADTIGMWSVIKAPGTGILIPLGTQAFQPCLAIICRHAHLDGNCRLRQCAFTGQFGIQTADDLIPCLHDNQPVHHDLLLPGFNLGSRCTTPEQATTLHHAASVAVKIGNQVFPAIGQQGIKPTASFVWYPIHQPPALRSLRQHRYAMRQVAPLTDLFSLQANLGPTLASGHPDMQGSVAAPLPLDAEVALSPANQIWIPGLPERTPMGHQVHRF